MTQYEFYLALAAIIVIPTCLCVYVWLLTKGGGSSDNSGYDKFIPKLPEYTHKTRTEYYKPKPPKKG